MTIAASPIRRILIGILPSAILGLVAFVVYAYQSHALADYEINRSFRALNMMGNQIKSGLNAEEDAVVRTGREVGSKDGFTTGMTFVSLPLSAGASGKPSDWKKWTVDLAKMVEPLMRMDVFDSVLVATQDGTVLAQDPGMLFRIDQLQALMLARIGTGKAADTPRSGGTDKNREPPIALRSESFPVRLGEDDYTVFLHPVSLRQRSENGKGIVKLVVAGIAKRAEFSPVNLLNPAYLEFLFIFCITLLAGLPLQRIFSLIPGQRFRRRDGVLILGSGVVLVSMLTCWLLDFYYDSVWNSDVDSHLTRIAGKISDNFRAELKEKYDALICLDWQMEQQASQLKEVCLQMPEVRETQKGQKLVDVLVDHREFPFETAEWLNQYGTQRIKWTVRDAINSFGQRKNRAYFQDLKHGSKNTYEFEETLGSTFSLQRLHTWEDGKYLTVMGIPMNPPKKPCLTTRVAGFQTISVGPIILPPNIQYAVVDGEGVVLYHGNETRVLVENFADECERSSGVVAARIKMASRKDCAGEGELSRSDCGPFEAEYEGKHRRMYVQALAVKGLPWSVVVYADANKLEQQEGRVLRKALFFFLLYGLTVGTVLLMLYLDRRRWWVAPPWSEVPARLAFLFAILLCIIVCFALLVTSPRIFIVIGSAFFWPIAGIGAAAFALTTKFRLPVWLQPTKDSRPWLIHSFTQLRWPQFSAAVSLVVLVSILPCFAFWKAAFTLHREKTIRQGQVELSNSLEMRSARLAKQYEGIRFVKERKDGSEQSNDKERQTFLRSRDPLADPSAKTPDLYLNVFFNSSIQKPPLGPCNANTGTIEKIEQGFRRISMLLEDPEDKRWQRCGERLFLRRTDPTLPVLVSNLPPPVLPANGTVLAQTSILLVLFCTLLYFALCRLLYLDRRSVLFATSESPRKLSVRNLLLTGAPNTGKSEALKEQKDFSVINLFDYNYESLMELATPATWPDAAKTYAIDQLEYGIDDPKLNGAVLFLLERLVFRSTKRVVVISNVNPILYMRNDDQFSRTQVERWVDRLASFQIRDFGTKEDFTIQKDAFAQTYHAVWRSCSRQERAVLLNLAKDGLVNPKDRALLGELRRRGIVLKNPFLCFRDPDFGEFIRSVYGPEQLASWDEAMRGSSGVSSWNLFLGLFVLVGIGLSFKGYEALGPVIASVSGAINLLVTVKNQVASQSVKTGDNASAKTA